MTQPSAPCSSTTGCSAIPSLSSPETYFSITREDVASVLSVRLTIYLWPGVVPRLIARPEGPERLSCPEARRPEPRIVDYALFGLPFLSTAPTAEFYLLVCELDVRTEDKATDAGVLN